MADNIPEDLSALEQKISRMRSKDKKTLTPDKRFGAVQVGFRAATDLLSGIIVGGAIGFVLDKFFDLSPLFLIIFLLFGSAAGFLNVYRLAKQHEKNNEKEAL